MAAQLLDDLVKLTPSSICWSHCLTLSGTVFAVTQEVPYTARSCKCRVSAKQGELMKGPAVMLTYAAFRQDFAHIDFVESLWEGPAVA